MIADLLEACAFELNDDGALAWLPVVDAGAGGHHMADGKRRVGVHCPVLAIGEFHPIAGEGGGGDAQAAGLDPPAADRAAHELAAVLAVEALKLLRSSRWLQQPPQL